MAPNQIFQKIRSSTRLINNSNSTRVSNTNTKNQNNNNNKSSSSSSTSPTSPLFFSPPLSSVSEPFTTSRLSTATNPSSSGRVTPHEEIENGDGKGAKKRWRIVGKGGAVSGVPGGRRNSRSRSGDEEAEPREEEERTSMDRRVSTSSNGRASGVNPRFPSLSGIDGVDKVGNSDSNAKEALEEWGKLLAGLTKELPPLPSPMDDEFGSSHTGFQSSHHPQDRGVDERLYRGGGGVGIGMEGMDGVKVTEWLDVAQVDGQGPGKKLNSPTHELQVNLERLVIPTSAPPTSGFTFPLSPTSSNEHERNNSRWSAFGLSDNGPATAPLPSAHRESLPVQQRYNTRRLARNPVSFDGPASRLPTRRSSSQQGGEVEPPQRPVRQSSGQSASHGVRTHAMEEEDDPEDEGLSDEVVVEDDAMDTEEDDTDSGVVIHDSFDPATGDLKVSFQKPRPSRHQSFDIPRPGPLRHQPPAQPLPKSREKKFNAFSDLGLGIRWAPPVVAEVGAEASEKRRKASLEAEAEARRRKKEVKEVEEGGGQGLGRRLVRKVASKLRKDNMSSSKVDGADVRGFQGGRGGRGGRGRAENRNHDRSSQLRSYEGYVDDNAAGRSQAFARSEPGDDVQYRRSFDVTRPTYRQVEVPPMPNISLHRQGQNRPHDSMNEVQAHMPPFPSFSRPTAQVYGSMNPIPAMSEPDLSLYIRHSVNQPYPSRSVLPASALASRSSFGAGEEGSDYPYEFEEEEAVEEDDEQLARKKEKYISKKKKGHIKRPPNAFILYRSELCKKGGAQQASNVAGHREISKIAGDLWRALSDRERAPYVAAAQRAKEEHERLYPDYKYQPVTKNKPRPGSQQSQSKSPSPSRNGSPAKRRSGRASGAGPSSTQRGHTLSSPSSPYVHDGHWEMNSQPRLPTSYSQSSPEEMIWNADHNFEYVTTPPRPTSLAGSTGSRKRVLSHSSDVEANPPPSKRTPGRSSSPLSHVSGGGESIRSRASMRRSGGGSAPRRSYRSDRGSHSPTYFNSFGQARTATRNAGAATNYQDQVADSRYLHNSSSNSKVSTPFMTTTSSEGGITPFRSSTSSPLQQRCQSSQSNGGRSSNHLVDASQPHPLPASLQQYPSSTRSRQPSSEAHSTQYQRPPNPGPVSEAYLSNQISLGRWVHEYSQAGSNDGRGGVDSSSQAQANTGYVQSGRLSNEPRSSQHVGRMDFDPSFIDPDLREPDAASHDDESGHHYLNNPPTVTPSEFCPESERHSPPPAPRWDQTSHPRAFSNTKSQLPSASTMDGMGFIEPQIWEGNIELFDDSCIATGIIGPDSSIELTANQENGGYHIGDQEFFTLPTPATQGYVQPSHSVAPTSFVQGPTPPSSFHSTSHGSSQHSASQFWEMAELNRRSSIAARSTDSGAFSAVGDGSFQFLNGFEGHDLDIELLGS